MKARFAIVLLAGLIVGAAGSQGGDDGDQKKVQGTWQVVSMEVRGKALGEVKDQSVVFTKELMTFKAGDKTDGEFAYTIDSAKKPKWIDLAPVRNGKKSAKIALGIYELNGDTLKICHPDPDKDRSTAFKSAPDSNLIILKR